MKMIKTTVIFIVLLVCHQVLADDANKEVEVTALSIGERVVLQSEVLNENRVINVYLPQGYSKALAKDYPVIYLLDGSIEEDFIHIAGLVQFGSFSWVEMLPESIVVGISNVDRRRDFTFPTGNERDKKDFPTTGHSQSFIRFIETELQPYIDAKYRTTSTKTLIGQSLGGLLATEILFKKPDLFDNYIITSPSLWWDD
ncbi:MAG: alpha/beta hydrolase-fold protein [Paraglaciecola sp.]